MREQGVSKMERILIKKWLVVALSILGAIRPMQTYKEEKPVPQNPVHEVNSVARQAAAKRSVHPKRRPTNLVADSRSYSYTFRGLATAEGQPATNARVEIRVTSDYAADMFQVSTGSDGRYTLTVPVTGKPNQTLSWEIRGLTSDLKAAGQAGHQILTDEHAVELDIPLALAEI